MDSREIDIYSQVMPRVVVARMLKLAPAASGIRGSPYARMARRPEHGAPQLDALVANEMVSLEEER
jgi:hypothetical protein